MALLKAACIYLGLGNSTSNLLLNFWIHDGGVLNMFILGF